MKKFKIAGVIIAILLFYFLYGGMSKENKKITDNNRSNEERIIDPIIPIKIDGNNVEHENSPDGEAYKKILESVYMNMNDVLNKEVTLSGEVYRENDFTEDRFVISRVLISGHGDHTHQQIAGLLCKWNDGSKLKGGQWVKVTGVISVENYHNKYTDKDELIPFIKATNVEVIEEPEEKNIYD